MAKAKKYKQYNGQNKEVRLYFFVLAIVLFVLLCFGHCIVCTSLFWPLYCLYFFNNGQNKEVQTIQWPKQRNTNKFNVFSSQGSIGYVNYRHHFMSVVVLTVDISEIKKVSLKTGNHLLYWTMLDKILRN
jgi:desulfoferrodoxin (superoxide reductase-like protein)